MIKCEGGEKQRMRMKMNTRALADGDCFFICFILPRVLNTLCCFKMKIHFYFIYDYKFIKKTGTTTVFTHIFTSKQSVTLLEPQRYYDNNI